MADNKNKEKGVDGDKELEDLLDSAIEDFTQPSKVEEVQNTKVEGTKPDEDVWGEEFWVGVQKQFEQNMKALFGQEGLQDGAASFDPEHFGAKFEQVAQEANKVLSEHAQNPQFTETIAQTLKNLSDNVENIDSGLGAQDISAMMEGLRLNGPDMSNDMLPIIQSVMKSFLSKDMLYGPIKEITEKYPTWLEENKNNLDAKDYESYKKQFHLMEEVCQEFEEERDSDSQEVKSARFNKVLGLMEEMQKLGQPPKDLVGEGVPFGLDDSKLANQVPGLDAAQCSLM